MRVRVITTAGRVARDYRADADAFPLAARAFLRSLAIQTENNARDLSNGPKSAKPGAYPIPVRSGTFKGAFGFEVDDDKAVAFNNALYAIPLHEGFRPYGNPHARPIPARRYFDDALDKLDFDEAQRAYEAAMPQPGGAA